MTGREFSLLIQKLKAAFHLTTIKFGEMSALDNKLNLLQEKNYLPRRCNELKSIKRIRVLKKNHVKRDPGSRDRDVSI